MTADELLDRIKLLETKQADSLGEKLNPFNQQEVLARLAVRCARLLTHGHQHKERTARCHTP